MLLVDIWHEVKRTELLQKYKWYILHKGLFEWQTIIVLSKVCVCGVCFHCRHTEVDEHAIQHCFCYTSTVLTSTLAFQKEQKLKVECQVLHTLTHCTVCLHEYALSCFCFSTKALLQVAKNLFTHLGKLSSCVCLSFILISLWRQIICLNEQCLSDHLVKRMVHVIEWDITDPKDDYTQHHNHKIKGPLKPMAPPLHPIITPGHLDSYLPVGSGISHWWFIQIAAANGSAAKANCLSLYQTVDYKSSYQLVQRIHQCSLCNLCFCLSRLCCTPLISSVSPLFPLLLSFLLSSLSPFSTQMMCQCCYRKL